jgi:hypothetical protein
VAPGLETRVERTPLKLCAERPIELFVSGSNGPEVHFRVKVAPVFGSPSLRKNPGRSWVSPL